MDIVYRMTEGCLTKNVLYLEKIYLRDGIQMDIFVWAKFKPTYAKKG